VDFLKSDSMPTQRWALNADLPNRLAWRLAALLGGTMALMAAFLHQGYLDDLQTQSPPLATTTSKGPDTTVLPEAEPITDSQRRLDFCAQHVIVDRSFVVFAHGTCVIVNEPDDDPGEHHSLNRPPVQLRVGVCQPPFP
jgi:hypothetical protein